jgi:dCMP deaminase
MLIALREATKSPDPSTQNGGVIVREGAILGTGCNEFPRGVAYLPERWERPAKYAYIEHAERNSIFDAVRCGNFTLGATLYCPWFACADCARAIIQAGIVRVVGLAERVTNERWNESIVIGDTMLSEAGVQIVRGQLAETAGISLRRNGDTVTF